MARKPAPETLEAALADVFDEAREQASWFTLPGGVRLFAAGDPADTLFLVRSGRLGVFRQEEGQDAQFLGVVKPGEPAGEMALIAGTAHTATVVAMRDSEVLALPREAFFAAAAARPALMMELARLMILRARQTREGGAEPTVFGFIGLSDRPIGPFVRLVEAEVAALGFTVKTVTSQALRSATEWFAAIEESHDIVLYVAERDETAWSHLCARQVDRLFLVGRAAEDPRSARPWQGDAFDSHRTVDLVLLHRPTAVSPEGTGDWLDKVAPGRCLHVRGADRRDAGRLARVLTGTSVGLVLSGGGARAFAHIGAVRALEEADVPIDFVGGSSMGGIVAAAIAMGWSREEMDARIRAAFVASSPVDDMAIPILALSRGKKVEERLRQHFGETRIEDLWRPFYCVSSNITSGGYVVHRRGVLRHALRASIAIPGLLPPVIEGGAVLVDGAVMRNFPVDLMRAWHLGPVIGVDVSRSRGVDPAVVDMPMSFMRWILSGKWRQGPPIVSILMRSATLSTKADLLEARAATDLLIVPNPVGVEIRDWKAYDAAVANGYATAKEALAKLDGPVIFLRRRKLRNERSATVEAIRAATRTETRRRRRATGRDRARAPAAAPEGE